MASVDELDAIRTRIANISTFNKCGDLIKLSRWKSVSEVWPQWRLHAKATRIILADMAESAGGGDVMLEGTMADSDIVAAAMKRNGVVKSAHKGLTDEVSWHMDVLVFTSRTQTLLYEKSHHENEDLRGRVRRVNQECNAALAT